MPSSAAAARAAASDTPRIAFAPRRALFGVPSSSSIARSRPCWSSASSPVTAAAISPFTFSTARRTPLPPQASPPSRSSTASNSPVEAPEGTAARPPAPERSATSTSTVGLPRLSRIWRAWTCSISLIPGGILTDLGPAALGRRSEGELGVDAAGARELHEGEQCGAHRGPGVGAGGQPRELLRERAGRPLSTRPPPHPLGAPKRLARVQERGKVLGHVVEQRPAAPALVLDLVPPAPDLGRGFGRGVAEHVRVPADELRTAAVGDRGERPGAALLEQQGEEVHLEQDVAELVEQLGVVA